jgi:hypothetical protein
MSRSNPRFNWSVAQVGGAPRLLINNGLINLVVVEQLTTTPLPLSCGGGRDE